MPKHSDHRANEAATPMRPVKHAHYVNDPDRPFPYDSQGQTMEYDQAGALHQWGLTLHRHFPPIAFGAAVVIGVVLAATLIANGTLFPAASTPEQVKANATAEVSYNLPQAADLADATADSLTSLSDSIAGATYDNTKDEEKSAGGIDLIHLPEGVDLATAGAWYLQGVDKISAADAARLLNGSWRVTLASSSAYDCRLRYALFSTPDQQTAIDQARTALGLDDAPTTDQGTDSYGNTYVEGTYEGDGGTRTWRIAACPLTSVYSNDGLPEDASYVVASFK